MRNKELNSTLGLYINKSKLSQLQINLDFIHLQLDERELYLYCYLRNNILYLIGERK